MVSFRVGPGDSVVLGKYFEPVFEAADLTRLNNQNIFVSMIIDGEKVTPFSSTTLRMPDPEADLTDKIIEQSRAQYASNREEVELDIRARTEETEVGARALATQIDTPKPGAHPYTPRTENDQKPNTPKSEFLAALKNPDAPAHAPQRDDRRGDRSNDNRRNDNHNKSAGPFPKRGESSAPRNEAVRAAIANVQSNLAPSTATNHSGATPSRVGQGSESPVHHSINPPAPSSVVRPAWRPRPARIGFRPKAPLYTITGLLCIHVKKGLRDGHTDG